MITVVDIPRPETDRRREAVRSGEAPFGSEACTPNMLLVSR